MSEVVKKICFFYPHKQRISGGLQYFYLLALYVGKKEGFTTYIMNYRGHSINDEFQSRGLNILNYEDTYNELDNDTVFFVYVNMLPLFLERFKHLKNAKIFIIAFHTRTWNYLFHHLSISKQSDIDSILSLLYNKNALAFMDESCLDIANKLSKYSFTPKYIPGFLEQEYSQYYTPDIITKNEINIGYIGRLDGDKIYQAINLLQNADRIKTNKTVKVHIIGDGQVASKIQPKLYPHIVVIFQKTLKGDSLREYLSQNTDMLVAAGMACIEGAAIKLPAVMPVYESKPHQIDKYFLLHDLNDYFLGGTPSYMEEKGWPPYSLQEIVEMIYNRHKKKELGKRSYAYFINNHSIDYSTICFLQYVKQTDLTIGDMLKIRRIKNNINNFSTVRAKGLDYEDFLKIPKRNSEHLVFLLNYYTQNIRVKMQFLKGCILSPYSFMKGIKKRIFSLYYRIKSDAANIYAIPAKLDAIRINNAITLLPYTYRLSFFAKRKDNKQLEHLLHFSAIQESHKRTLSRLAGYVSLKRKLKVAFFVMYDPAFMQIKPIYDLMKQDNIFDPFIVVTPDMLRGGKNMHYQMQKTYNHLFNQGVNVYKAYNEATKKFIDFTYKIDILYSVNPYKVMDHPLYQVENLINKGVLPFYISYFYLGRTKYELMPLKSDIYTYYWKIFTENYIGERLLLEHSQIDGRNAVVSGYVKMDNIINIKKQAGDRKKIIIAPHHTVGNKPVDVSTFLIYSDYFLILPEKYPQIDFVFRPHQLLKTTLEKKEYWGIERTNRYYEQMASHPNVEYQDGGDYLDTFVNSDALIHDCGSFLAEYCYTDHPQLYLHRDRSSRERIFLPFGEDILDLSYEAYVQDDIDDFIQNVVLSDNDPKKEKRIAYANSEIRINVGSAARFVVDYIKKEIGASK